jgi:hypothetical protein
MQRSQCLQFLHNGSCNAQIALDSQITGFQYLSNWFGETVLHQTSVLAGTLQLENSERFSGSSGSGSEGFIGSGPHLAIAFQLKSKNFIPTLLHFPSILGQFSEDFTGTFFGQTKLYRASSGLLKTDNFCFLLSGGHSNVLQSRELFGETEIAVNSKGFLQTLSYLPSHLFGFSHHFKRRSLRVTKFSNASSLLSRSGGSTLPSSMGHSDDFVASESLKKSLFEENSEEFIRTL